MDLQRRAYIGATSMRLVGAVALTVGLVGAVAAVGSAVEGVLDAGGPVVVPGVAIYGDLDVDFGAPPFQAPGLPAGSEFHAVPSDWLLSAPGSTVAEQLLARSDTILLGLGLLVGTFLLRGLLLSIADGRPFGRRNARRLAGIALLVLLGSLASVLPDLAGVLALERLGEAGADSPYRASVSWEVSGLWFVWPVLLALAEAFRRGAELADDVSGLV